MTTVLICDDRRSVREGLTRVMSAVPGVHRIDCVAHGDELLARYSRQPVDVVLVGTQRAVPTGVEATRRLVAAHPQANVIVFGAPDDAGSIAAAIAGGARGYLRWDASRPELVAALAHTLASTAVPTPRAPTDPGGLGGQAGWGSAEMASATGVTTAERSSWRRPSIIDWSSPRLRTRAAWDSRMRAATPGAMVA